MLPLAALLRRASECVGILPVLRRPPFWAHLVMPSGLGPDVTKVVLRFFFFLGTSAPLGSLDGVGPVDSGQVLAESVVLFCQVLPGCGVGTLELVVRLAEARLLEPVRLAEPTQ